MRRPSALAALTSLTLFTIPVLADTLPQPASPPPALSQDQSFSTPLGTAVVKSLHFTPVVENDFSKRFRFDAHDNPSLKQLREQEKLDAVVAPGADEFDRQVLLLDWVYNRFRKFGKPTTPGQTGALDILKAIDEGHTFYCTHYGDTLVSAAAAMGWVCRELGLRVGNRAHGTGAAEHTITEIWSNQHNKWTLFDPTYALYVERDGTPLSAWEVRQEWFYGDADKLTFVIGKERKRCKAADMPIVRAHHPGFGNLTLDKRTVDKLALMMLVPNTDFMTARKDYDKAFILTDALAEGVKWHRRDIPKDPGADAYFPLHQAALQLAAIPASADVKVTARTNTPNFKTFRYRIDNNAWTDAQPTFNWPLHAGANTLEVISINAFDIPGPPSKVQIDIE